MHVQPTPYTLPAITGSNLVQQMHPPLSTTSNNTIIRLSQEHRLRLYQTISDLTDDQLRLFLTNHLQSLSNTTLNNQFQHYSRTQLIQQSYILVDNYYSVDLEQTLATMRQKRFTPNYQQQVYQSAPQPPPPPQQQQQPQQQNYASTYNHQPFCYNQPNLLNSIQSNYRFPLSTNVSQPLRSIRPNPTAGSYPSPLIRPQQQQRQQQQQSSYFISPAPRQQFNRPSLPSGNVTNGSSTSSIISRYQVPILPPPPNTAPRLIHPTPPSPLNIVHKTLPFYRSLTCVYECYQAFRYDTYRKQHVSRNEFLLSVDVCNQLALSSDYDPDLDTLKTSKCLILRLTRIDQPPMSNGKYDDHLPPNLVIQVNSQHLTNLPVPKPCARQQTDLIRIGREVDITSYCMFNPTLNNEVAMSWSYRPDNMNIHSQYINAKFALHIFLVQHLTAEDLCEQVKNKTARFYREDLVNLLAKAIATDRDLGLEVSDQKLKLKCPIDQRQLKIPIRAITCQHLQCFDLTNYIVLNEKAGKWICPVCNKSALFDDLQIDSYTESILTSIGNENLSEITIDSNLNWTPVTSSSFIMEQQHFTSIGDDIILDDDQPDQKPLVIDSKANIRLIRSPTSELADVILIDD